MTLKSVDLPAPFGPISPVIEPVGDLDRGAVDGPDAAEMHVQVLDADHAAPPVGGGRPRGGRPPVVVDQRIAEGDRRRCP